MAQQGISISAESIIRVFVVAGLFWLAYRVSGVLFLIFLSLVLATILNPLAEWGLRRHIPRAVLVIGLYIVGIGLFVGVGYVLVPLLAQELGQIQQNFGNYLNQVLGLFPNSIATPLREYTQNGVAEFFGTAHGNTAAVGRVLNTVQGVFGLLGSLIAVLVLAYYMVAEQHAMRKLLAHFVPNHHAALMERIIRNIEQRLGGWARGQIILSLIIGVMVYIMLLVIGVPYAFALAALAALLEAVPYVGPLISGLFGVFFALTVSPTIALITAIAYYVVQFLENNLIVPKIMQRTAGVSPVLSLISIMLCYELTGLIGVFIGVPIASVVIAVFDAYNKKKE